LACENSLAAFAEAANLGVDVVELDVHQTVDGQVLVIHDEVRRADRNVPLLASINYNSATMPGGLGRTIDRLRRISNCAIAIEKKLLRVTVEANRERFSISDVGVWVVNGE
jgi:glycerophosphoryl diester phosphodiesterase